MEDEDKLRVYRKYWDQYKDLSYILSSACYHINRERPNRHQAPNVANTSGPVGEVRSWIYFVCWRTMNSFRFRLLKKHGKGFSFKHYFHQLHTLVKR